MIKYSWMTCCIYFEKKNELYATRKSNCHNIRNKISVLIKERYLPACMCLWWQRGLRKSTARKSLEIWRRIIEDKSECIWGSVFPCFKMARYQHCLSAIRNSKFLEAEKKKGGGSVFFRNLTNPHLLITSKYGS